MLGLSHRVIPNFIDPSVYDRSRYEPQPRDQVNGDTGAHAHLNFRAVKRVP
jgi:hypothetical protein